MYRHIFMNKWVLGGIGFLILLSIACVVWYQHDIADEKKAAAEAEELLRQSEIAKKVSNADSRAEQAADETTAESTTPTAEKQKFDTTAEVEKDGILNETDAILTQQTQEADKEVRVSPYGFGPYPKLPPGFPENYWDTRSKNKEAELLGRVQIKLIEQGKNVLGASMQNGLVYPSIPGTIYVEWDGVGTERYVAGILGDPFTIYSIPGYSPGLKLTEKDIPAGIEVINYPNGGIDPYQFLGLKE
ncbi:MAG: hypothetical protein OXI67_10045 [Candidatus Poribacteria bacterium]|nr:hypothetical protein [Candidatus Poribacteria bacterium]